MQKQSITILHQFDPDGIEVVVVSLSNSDRSVTLYGTDYKNLEALGAIPPWYWCSDNNVYVSGEKRPVALARVLRDAGIGQKVAFLDGDHGNLRRNNIVLMPGPGKTKSVDQIKKRFRYHRPEIKHVYSDQ